MLKVRCLSKHANTFDVVVLNTETGEEVGEPIGYGHSYGGVPYLVTLNVSVDSTALDLIKEALEEYEDQLHAQFLAFDRDQAVADL